MKLSLQPGTYVVAVSGGVDSMVLLDLLRQEPGLKLVVAHFDHGMRPESYDDLRLVQDVTRKHGLPFVFDQARLGPGTSEAAARQARYDFLRRVRQAAGARAIITAHHQDDLLETAFINSLRGTGRRGLSSLNSRTTLVRPLLNVPKAELRKYAQDHKLKWHEDSTNHSDAYLRNRIRHYVLPLLSGEDRRQMVSRLNDLKIINQTIDRALANYLHTQRKSGALDRQRFIMLPHNLAREVMAFWLTAQGIKGLTTARLEVITSKAKTLGVGKRVSVDQDHFLQIKTRTLALQTIER